MNVQMMEGLLGASSNIKLSGTPLYDNVMIVTAVKEQPPQEMPAEKKKKPKSKGER